MNELLWHLSRATGIASIVLLTLVLVLGLVTAGRGPARPANRAAVVATHRLLGLGLGVFVLAHVATAVGETYVRIDLVSVLLPFTSGYEPLAVGLGTLALDLLLAVVVTSALRHRLPERAWRWVHWSTYLLWPLAVLHGLALGTSGDGWLRATTLACAAVGAGALVWRLRVRDADTGRREAVLEQVWS